jgi:drug/metabolite transporter (DMT)-like permease
MNLSLSPKLKSQLPILAVALSGITFGTIGYSGTYLLSVGMSVSQMLFWRFSIAAFSLLFLIKWPSVKAAKKTISFKAIAYCFLLGGVAYSLSTSFFFSSIPYIGSGIAMVIFYAFPILVALLNWGIDGKKLTLLEGIAIAMMIPGILLLANTDNIQFDPYGMLLGAGSALFYGIYFYGSKKGGQTLPALLSSFVVCLGNTFFFASVCWIKGEIYLPQTFMVWIQCIGFAVVGTLIPLGLLFMGLKTVPVTKAALISILEPITTVMIGVLLLEETLSFGQIAGIALMFLAVIIVQLKAHPHSEALVLE